MTRHRSVLFLVLASFLLSLLAGCIIRTEPRHRHHRREVRGHGSHQHCHYKGGPHRRRVCHSHPHGGGHH
jgi:hypothetical protein